jgi:hypothetical protein
MKYHPNANNREGSLLRNDKICFYRTMSQTYSSRKDDCLYQRIIQIILFQEMPLIRVYGTFTTGGMQNNLSMCWQIYTSIFPQIINTLL